MFKRNDYVIISLILFFLGVFVVSQYYAGKKYEKIIQPETNDVLAVEVAKLTSANADLRIEVQTLTANLDAYKNSSESNQKAFDQYSSDSQRLDAINGLTPQTGQGIIISVKGGLGTPQIVDLVNAIKNIGAEVISVNGQRLMLNANLGAFSGQTSLEIKVLGNSQLLKSAIERKGGIMDQIAEGKINFSIDAQNNITVPAGNPINFKYAKIVQ